MLMKIIIIIQILVIEEVVGLVVVVVAAAVAGANQPLLGQGPMNSLGSLRRYTELRFFFFKFLC